MSAYQYYEFRVVDRQLTPDEMQALRRITSRATITPTMLKNVYDYGDFGGEPLDLMRRYSPSSGGTYAATPQRCIATARAPSRVASGSPSRMARSRYEAS